MKFKLKEEKLRKIIRTQLKLTEAFVVGSPRRTEISDCNLVTDPGAGIAKKTVKMANTISKFYGVPGSFCAVIAAMTPGISQNTRPDQSSTRSREQRESQESEQVEVRMLKSIEKDIATMTTIYTFNVLVENPAAPENESAWQNAKISYEALAGTVDTVFTEESDPLNLAERIMNKYFAGEGSKSDIRGEIKTLKDYGQSDEQIKSELLRQTKSLMNMHVNYELTHHLKRASDAGASEEIKIAINDYKASSSIF